MHHAKRETAPSRHSCLISFIPATPPGVRRESDWWGDALSWPHRIEIARAGGP
jgi:hypothetical protein